MYNKNERRVIFYALLGIGIITGCGFYFDSAYAIGLGGCIFGGIVARLTKP
jgi:hypothetical protein